MPTSLQTGKWLGEGRAIFPKVERSWEGGSESEPRFPGLGPGTTASTVAAPVTGGRGRKVLLSFGREMHFRNRFPKNIPKGFISNEENNKIKLK